jgi:LPS sulfotransferase NodH
MEEELVTKPDICYTIWFRQRQGSTMLCDLLNNTGIAGHPGEWIGPYYETPDLLALHNCRGLLELQEELWALGSTENRVLGVKMGFIGHCFSQMMSNLRTSQKLPHDLADLDVWERIFPNHRHIYLTRRSKLLQAISWWKAIQTDIWHKTETTTLRSLSSVHGHVAEPDGLEDRYDFNAIMHLIGEIVANESELQDAFTRRGITPLTIVYEDFVTDKEKTVHGILEYLGLSDRPTVGKSRYHRLSDDLSERWYERLLADIKGDWRAHVEQAHPGPISEAAQCAATEEAGA